MRRVLTILAVFGRPQLWVVLVAVAVGVIAWPSAAPSAALVDHRGGHAVHAASTVPVDTAVQAPPPVDCAAVACLALTFDDGPNAVVTPQILDILQRHHVRATFFLVGVHVPGNEVLVRRMYAEGHEIGNHSWSHPDFTTLTPDQIRQQIVATQAAITAAGVPAPKLFRPPYGAINQVVASNVPLTVALWNVDPEDWNAHTPAQVIQNVESGAAPGRIVDMHDTSPATAQALDQLLNDLTPHYQLVTVSELFKLAPGQRGLYYGR